MDKFTIEEKANRYDIAVELAAKFKKEYLNYKVLNVHRGVIEAFNSIFPELKESEDEKVREIIRLALESCNTGKGYIVCDDNYAKCLSWLEKQGEQKPTIEMKSAEESLGIDSETYNKIVDECIYGEQKPANKVEPKFKVGDWITDGDYTWKIVEVKPLDYILQSQDGNIVDDTISHVDEQFHSFTIEDAKDGDVLVGGGAILMFRRIGNTKWDDVIDYHCYYDCYRENFIVQKDVQYWGNTENNQLNPSTKEQRDILFQKMKEAGYEWDAEKKKLNKISQRMVSAEAKEAMYDKPAWSEEDEEFLRRAINAAKDVYPMTANWLKSLKERCAWKPSDEQMELLKDASARYEGLQSLYNDLNKLKGE